MADTTANPDDTIALTIRVEGEMVITVNRAEYEAAKRDGAVDDFLDHDLSDLDGENTVIEPDGRSYNPHDQPHGPTDDMDRFTNAVLRSPLDEPSYPDVVDVDLAYRGTIDIP